MRQSHSAGSRIGLAWIGLDWIGLNWIGLAFDWIELALFGLDAGFGMIVA